LLNEFFEGKVKIAQIGHGSHIHPRLDGVLNLVGKTDLRQLIRLAYHAEGSIGPISFQFVLSAALEQPAVVVAGGKEGIRWHIYNHIQYLYMNGTMACCRSDGCWKGGKRGDCIDLVNEIPKCFHLTEPYMIADAVKRYYLGGRLEMPDDDQLAQWKKRFLILEPRENRQKAFNIKLASHKLDIIDRSSLAEKFLRENHYDVISLSLDPRVEQGEIVNKDSIEFLKYLSTNNVDCHTMTHGIDDRAYGEVLKMSPGIEWRRAYWV